MDMIKTINIADIAGFLFLGLGLMDGYRKGLVKKGTSLLVTAGSLVLVYLISPVVESLLRQILPVFLDLDKLSANNDLYRLIVLSGFHDRAEEYVQLLAARVISLVVTYVVMRVILGTVISSLHLLAKVPGLSLLNRLAGAAFGLLQQILILWLLFLVVAVFSYTFWGGVAYNVISQSAYLSQLYDNNLLLLIGMFFMIHI